MRRTLLLLLLCSTAMYAWDDCPFGLSDDPAPGRCRLYTDSNQDGMCDLSQQEPAPVVPASCDSAEIPSHPVPETKPLAEAASPVSDTPADPIPPTDRSQANERTDAGDGPSPSGPIHHVWEIFLATSILALATELAAGRRRGISFALQTAWNWILLSAFLLCSLTGLFFLFPAAVQSPFALSVSYWHTETGLAFVAIGAYHAVRRFSCMVRGLKGCFARR